MSDSASAGSGSAREEQHEPVATNRLAILCSTTPVLVPNPGSRYAYTRHAMFPKSVPSPRSQ